MILTRRTMFAGLAATLAAPAIIRTPGLLMPIKPVITLADISAIIDAKMQAMADYIIQQSEDGIMWGEVARRPWSDLHQTQTFTVPAGARYTRLVLSAST